VTHSTPTGVESFGSFGRCLLLYSIERGNQSCSCFGSVYCFVDANSEIHGSIVSPFGDLSLVVHAVSYLLLLLPVLFVPSAKETKNQPYAVDESSFDVACSWKAVAWESVLVEPRRMSWWRSGSSIEVDNIAYKRTTESLDEVILLWVLISNSKPSWRAGAEPLPVCYVSQIFFCSVPCDVM
jgi:hypothetical protein